MAQITKHPTIECKKSIQAVHDSMYVLGGKWKISIVAALLFGPRRYSDMLRDVVGISGKMLSRELKEMETNLLVKRTVSDTLPIMVTYELTKYGRAIEPVIIVLAEWGETHRKCIGISK